MRAVKQWFPAWKFLISAMSSLVLSKRFHFPARPLCLLIGTLQRFKRKEKIISDIWNQLKWLSVENASILGSLNSVIKWSLSCCKERFALKWFLRQREIRLFLPRRKILLNPYAGHRGCSRAVQGAYRHICQGDPRLLLLLPRLRGCERSAKAWRRMQNRCGRFGYSGSRSCCR